MSKIAAPDVYGAITAYRSWPGYGFKQKRLMSYQRTSWPTDKPLQAKCPRNRHHVPNPGCTCGIYARKKASSVPQLEGPTVYGSVKLWGRVQEHEEGYRAEYAQITALSDPAWAEIYKVPVCEVPSADLAEQTTWSSASGYLTTTMTAQLVRVYYFTTHRSTDGGRTYRSTDGGNTWTLITKETDSMDGTH